MGRKTTGSRASDEQKGALFCQIEHFLLLLRFGSGKASKPKETEDVVGEITEKKIS
jgi:hypothetical protein